MANAGALHQDQDVSSQELQFYPQEYWGLDYYFRTFNKMYIKDILQMEEYPMFPGAYAYKNHPIYKVDVMGVVVKVTQNQKCFMYTVDDGTGTIICCCWKTSFYQNKDDMSELPAELKQKAREITESMDRECDGYSLGDLISVKGKIKVFREQREIVASSHNKILDPMAEVYRIAELPILYTQNYDKPFILPHKVAQVVAMVKEEEMTGVKSEKRIFQELKAAMLEHFKASRLATVSSNQLTSLPTIKDILSQKTSRNESSQLEVKHVTQALHQLQLEGQVYQRTDRRDVFEVLSNNCPVDGMIKKILTRDSSKPKYAEKGCHYLHIMDELRKTYQYSKIQENCVQTCLNRLEADSDIIRTTQYHYMCYSI